MQKEGLIHKQLRPNKRARRPRSSGVKPDTLEGERLEMTWLQTYSGKAYVIADPDPDQICLEDIARALSNQCRFAGHSRYFYSVAEHSVHVCNRVREILEIGSAINHSDLGDEDRLIVAAALLHDASEAYLLDIPRPLKIEDGMSFYRGMHAKTMTLILEKYGLPTEKLDIIKQADNELLSTEKKQIMAPAPRDWGPMANPLPLTLNCWNPERAHLIFLEQAKALGLTDGNDN